MYNRTNYMPEFMARKQICDIGKRMYNRGYVAANDGNISVRIGRDTILCTPTGVSKGFMTPDMLVKLNMKGERRSGTRKASSEIKMHLRVYKENPEVMAVTHAHPPIATSFAIGGIELDKALLPEAVVMLGTVPIAPYATPGTEEVPESIAPYCKDHNAVLLANHGALTWGSDLIEAYYRMESLEHYAAIMMYTSNIIGKSNELSCGQVERLIEIRKNLGITSGGKPVCSIEEKNKGPFISSSSMNQESMTQEKEVLLRSIAEKVTATVLNSNR